MLPQIIEIENVMSNEYIQLLPEQLQQVSTKTTNRIQIIYQCASNYLGKKKNSIYIGLLLISIIIHIKNYLYFSNLVICPYQNFKKCMEQYFVPLGQNWLSFGPYIAGNMIAFLFQFHIFVNGNINRLYSGFSLMIFSWFYLLGERKASIFNMDGLVKSAHIALSLESFIVYFTFYALYLCAKRVKSLKKYIWILIVLFSLFLIIIRLTKQCSDWGEGINGRVQDGNDLCRMVIPNCHVLKLVAWTNFNFLYHNCFLGDIYKKGYNGYFSKDIQNGTIVAFNDFKHASDVQISSDHIFQKIYQTAQRFKTLQEAKKSGKQYDVLFDTEDQRYYIQLNRNETLAKIKMEKWEAYQRSQSPPISKNILFIFLDAVSRFQLRYKLPKTYKWFQQRSVFHSYKQQNIGVLPSEGKGYQTYQFYRFLSISWQTIPHIQAMSYDAPLNKAKYQNFIDKSGLALQLNDTINRRLQNVVQYYNERGFITGTAHSFCMPYLDYLYEEHIPYRKFPQFDHQTLSYNCDPNFITQEDTFDFIKGINAVTDRCLYHKRIAEYNIEYAQSFFQKYKKQPKLYMLNFMQGHALHGNSLKYIDPDISGFLNRLQTNGVLNDTVIIMLSDHGQHLSTIPSIVADHFNPLLMLYLPKKVNDAYRDKIRKNQQNTVSMYNVHHFLRHLAEGEDYKKKHLGLFGDLTSQKTCEDVLVYQNEKPSYCYCK